MARVLIVSRNPAMAMGLSATDYEVVDLRPPALADWITSDDDADALILDLDNPKLAVAAVTTLRAHAKLAPVLLVSSDRPGWDDPEIWQLPAADVLPLPISKVALLAALQDLIAEPWAYETVPPQHAEVTQALQELVLDPLDLLSEDDDLDALLTSPAMSPKVPTALAAPPVTEPEVVTEPEPEPEVVAEPGTLVAQAPPLSAVPRTRRSTRLPAGATSTSLRDMEALRPSSASATTVTAPMKAPRRRDQRPEPAVAAGRATERGRGESTAPARAAARADQSDDGVDLVRRLGRVAHTLYGVPETAEVVIVDAVERTRADAGALMVPDEGAWRVAAGVGLRPLESRYELHGDSWVVQQVAQAHKGVIVEESDIAREHLQGAPLASWRHLLAAPLPQVEALLLLARRDDPPFDEGDLKVLAELGYEAAPLLAAAIDTRALARSLWEFRDEADLPR